MLGNRAATNPLPHNATTTCSSSSPSASRLGSGHDSQPNPRASSEIGTVGSSDDLSSETRTSFTDEAQACYNLLLILRNDTQHLISLRNDSLPSLEAKPPGGGRDDNDAGVQLALLACINESIAAATRSIVELGPWLEKFRWPVSATTTPGTDRRSLLLRPVQKRVLFRKRSKSFSTAATDYHGAAGAALTPEELFSWTLALTGQHAAVLVATNRLDHYLQSGGVVSGVGEEEVKRREGRASWWEQGRGEFENVELIQSLLAPRPRRGFATAAKPTSVTDAAPSPDATAAAACQGASEPRAGRGEQADVPEQDDGRSETLVLEPLTEQSAEGLTAPRHHRQDSLQRDDPFFVSRVRTEPLDPPSPRRAEEARVLSRTETFGPAVPSSRHNLAAQRPRVATQPMPPLAGLHDVLAETSYRAETGRDHSAAGDGRQPPAATTTTTTAGRSSPPLATSQTPVPLLSSLLTPRERSTTATPAKNADGSQPSASAQRPVSSVSMAESTYTPFTPHTSADQRMVALFAARALPSKTIQPVIEALDNMMLVSPLEVESEQETTGATTLGVSPVDEEEKARPTTRASMSSSPPPPRPGDDDNNDDHRPYLAYMARKQAVTSSKW